MLVQNVGVLIKHRQQIGNHQHSALETDSAEPLESTLGKHRYGKRLDTITAAVAAARQEAALF